MAVITDRHRALIGREGERRAAAYAVNQAMARQWCEMLEDPNPIYFDEAYARSTWLRGTFAPPAMLQTWAMRPVWPKAEGESPIGKLRLEGCTVNIAVGAVQEYFMPFRYGDTLTMTSQFADISDEKVTRLGTGHFVMTADTFRNQFDQVVARQTLTVLTYRPHEGNAADRGGDGPEPARAGRGRANVRRVEESPAGGERQGVTGGWNAGDRLEPLSLELTLRRAVQAVAATRDYNPHHHDEKFAREIGAQGIFFNTMFLQGFVGRAATEWFGNDAFPRRLEIAMRGQNYVDRTLTAEGTVVAARESNGCRLVDVEGMLATEDGPTTGVKLTVQLPVAITP